MSGNINFDKAMGKKCCGIRGLRLSPRRLRLRLHFLYICRIFRRWKNSYNNCLKLLRRKMNLVRRRRRKNNRTGDSGPGYGCRATSFYGVRTTDDYRATSFSGARTMAHSNSFCSEAIADCLEFIKRNSVSVDDERKPMLNQD